MIWQRRPARRGNTSGAGSAAVRGRAARRCRSGTGWAGWLGSGSSSGHLGARVERDRGPGQYADAGSQRHGGGRAGRAWPSTRKRAGGPVGRIRRARSPGWLMVGHVTRTTAYFAGGAGCRLHPGWSLGQQTGWLEDCGPVTVAAGRATQRPDSRGRGGVAHVQARQVPNILGHAVDRADGLGLCRTPAPRGPRQRVTAPNRRDQ